MLRHDIKLNNKHDLKLVFRWNKLFRIREVDSIKETYILKELNETRFDETYAENRLKRFRTRDVRIEDAEKFEKKAETAEENFKEKFEMLKKKFDQIKELKEDQWNVHEISKDTAISINENNETFENNVMNICSDHNVVRNVVVTVKIKNWKLRNAAWAQNFRNK